MKHLILLDWSSMQFPKLHNPLRTYAVQARGSLRFYQYFFVGGKLRLSFREVAEGLRVDCGQYGSFAVFEAYLRFSELLFTCTAWPKPAPGCCIQSELM